MEWEQDTRNVRNITSKRSPESENLVDGENKILSTFIGLQNGKFIIKELGKSRTPTQLVKNPPAMQETPMDS